MNLQKLLCGVATALITTAGFAHAHDGAINDATLAAMGLGGATIVSDDMAMQVRGHGFAVAAGGSFAFVGGHQAAAGSANGYFAVGHHFAGGVNKSYAGKTVKIVHVVGGPQNPAPALHTPGPGPSPVPGPTKSITVKSIHVYAGGYSAAASF